VTAVERDSGKQLAWEARHRTRAGIASIAGAVFLFAYFVLEQMVLRDLPTSSFLQSLLRAAEPGKVGTLPSLRTPSFQYLHDKQGVLLIRAFAGFFGYVGLAWGAGFLSVATHARLATFRRYWMYLPLVGGIVVAVGVLFSQFANASLVNDFLAGPRHVENLPTNLTAFGKFAGVLSSLGTLLLAAGLLFVSLHAMRAGLLTRLLGYVGIVVGVGTVVGIFPQAASLVAIIEVFWLACLGLIFLRLWPGGEFPAWRTGNAEPWPVSPRAARAGAVQPAPAPALPREPQVRRKRKKRH
jgi:hypothetical protein